MRVEPPTSTTSSIFDGSTPASASACLVGPTVFCSRSSTSCSNLARVSFICRCLGPVWSAVMNGRLMSVSITVESSILAFSAASFRRCSAMRSLPRSIPSLFLNSRDDPVDDALIEVVAAEVRVAVGGLDLDHAFADFEDRDVERAAAEVEDGDRLVLLLVEAVGQRGRGRLVDDAHDFEAGDLAGVLGGLALRVVEVGGHGDDGLGDRLPEVVLGGLLQLLQDHRRDFRRRVASLPPALDAHVAVAVARTTWYGTIFISSRHFVELAAHEPLDREDRVLRVGHRLALGDLADQPLARSS